MRLKNIDPLNPVDFDWQPKEFYHQDQLFVSSKDQLFIGIDVYT